ncbi:DegT/DnrJ/EryC1/StrS family aminotransferase [Candidatus Nitrosotenuis aquarius]|uniref:DegT/DnrJ/EryC1/StrS family aminotransferase n=1 Tax=Candidatus Nitrosotenuis aquarius TaxID=1846278 RepID=UPI0013C2A226|nr:DegT/DnrJ/EryC1/StrS family aminotransferase [Candidatus Nitrosotenuis aquarius]
MKKLAVFGGSKTRENPFPKYPIITQDEKNAVLEVLESGNLSTFIASPGEQFLGGKKIREFENKFAKYIGTKFAVAFNSATSALHAAVVAVGVRPGEEVIVPPYTFTSTATCVLMHNAIPVFSDIKNDIYCLDPKKLENVRTNLTRAVIPVHLFGHPCDMDEIIEFASKHDLKIIEDCAQAPGAEYKGKKVGTIGDCGIFSFQETKNMMTGEGGMLVTNDEGIAKAAQMVRNHGEMINLAEKIRSYRSEILGWGYRMTELEAAIGIAQLSKLDSYNEHRIKLTSYLTEKLKSVDGIKHTKYDFVKHVYYVYSFSYDVKKIGITREKFCEAVRAEGIPIYGGYVKPLYLNPLYLEKRAFAYKHHSGTVKYEKGICPVAESLHENELIMIPICRPPATIDDMEDIVNAIRKVIENKDELLHE